MKYGMPTALVLGMGLLCTNVYANAYADMQRTSSDPMLQQMQNESKNKAEGNAFLEENKKKPGVVTLPDGLQYIVLEEGKGRRPSKDDTVTVHYIGTLINGKEFDSSYKRGEPATFPVTGVIPGWVEALQLMKEGSTWQLFIPASLAYGAQGAPPLIGPNETLIFKVNLISVNKKS
jgi:FKBP-type peptidyl-prolyl cis-trans isomerase FklB